MVVDIIIGGCLKNIQNTNQDDGFSYSIENFGEKEYFNVESTFNCINFEANFESGACNKYRYKYIRDNDNLKIILTDSEEELVSMDFKRNKFSSIVDLPLTMVNENLVKVCAWHDNEFGYTCRLVEIAEFVGGGYK